LNAGFTLAVAGRARSAQRSVNRDVHAAGQHEGLKIQRQLRFAFYFSWAFDFADLAFNVRAFGNNDLVIHRNGERRSAVDTVAILRVLCRDAARQRDGYYRSCRHNHHRQNFRGIHVD
jgi:hypothetical protein